MQAMPSIIYLKSDVCFVASANASIYCKIPIISPGLMFVQKAVLLSLFSEGLVIGSNFAFQNGFGLSIKTAKNTKITA